MRRGLILAALIAAVAATRFLFRSHMLYDLDSVDFGLALQRFDPSVFQPHPPGYFLYVMLGRLVNGLFGDANDALVMVSIAASCATAGAVYVLTKEWYGWGQAVVSVLLFLFSPLCWFHGTVALTYIVEAFFSALVGWLCWRVYSGSTSFVIPASIAFGLAAGFRPSAGLLLGPMWLASIYRVGWKHRLLGFGALSGTVVAWSVPMMLASGGVSGFFRPLVQLWVTVPGRRTALNDPASAIARVFTIAWILILCFGSSTLAGLGGSEGSPSRDRTRFIWIWIAPGLCFFSFVFLLFVNSGYLLLVAPPLFALLAARVHRFLCAARYPRLRWAALFAGAALNCAVFFFAPLYCSRKSIVDFERDLTAITRDFQSNLNAGDTLIIGFDSHFLGYRHAGYYLPQFRVVQYPEVASAGVRKVFAMQGRDTQLVSEFCLDRYKEFVFFPLPAGTEYAAYGEKIRTLLPADALRTRKVGGVTAFSASSEAIRSLFPATARVGCQAR
ncbi:MAG: DUF2723 domain-containing protein [Bryobacteraceae bacterium]